MHTPRVYVDTSVFGGAFDEEFDHVTRSFLAMAKAGLLRLVVSPLVVEEIAEAPPMVRDLFEQWSGDLDVAEVSEDAIALRQAYIAAGVVTQKALADALHVAIATVSGCGLVVSWNFRHIVHYQRIPMYNAVNAREGYGVIAIHSPQEVIGYEEEDL